MNTGTKQEMFQQLYRAWKETQRRTLTRIEAAREAGDDESLEIAYALEEGLDLLMSICEKINDIVESDSISEQNQKLSQLQSKS